MRLNLSFRNEVEKSLRSLNNPRGDERKGSLFVKATQLLARQVAFKPRLQGFLAFGLEMTGPDAPLELGSVVASVYDRGAYISQIDYWQLPPPPELSEQENSWLNELLRDYYRQK